MTGKQINLLIKLINISVANEQYKKMNIDISDLKDLKIYLEYLLSQMIIKIGTIKNWAPYPKFL